MKVKTIAELGISPTPWTTEVWTNEQKDDYGIYVIDSLMSCVTDCECASFVDSVNEANANLISASPDMYAALRDELRFLKWLLKADKKWLTERAVKRIKVIEDALRKAVGESVE